MKSFNRNAPDRRRQKGAITMFSAILILILLTEMIIFAVHTGVFEQRKSSNDARQKMAFHMADSGLQQARQFFQANAILIASDELELLPNELDNQGNPIGYDPGWLAEGRWTPCSGNYSTDDYTHPCWAEPVEQFRNNMYFYDHDDSIELPASLGNFDDDPTRRVSMHALLCMLDIDIDSTTGPPVSGCTMDPDVQDVRYFMVTSMARGEADCDTNSANCRAEALVSEKLGSYGPGGGEGGPDVPLTARTNVPLSGTVNVVPNPNGGGIGVPISSWVNANTSCGVGEDDEPVSTESGSYETCEAEGWYGTNQLPENLKCPSVQCLCKESEGDRLLSYSSGSERILGIDVVPDPAFPCDLWTYTFGTPKSLYKDVYDTVPTNHQLTDCSSLDATSAGFYWVSGETCNLPGGQIGSKNAPVFLISAAKFTTANAARTDFFGVLMVTDAEYADQGWACSENDQCGFKGTGGANIYGAAIMDAEMRHFRGNFSIVYVDSLIGLATESGGSGAVSGGWTDFHAFWR